MQGLNRRTYGYSHPSHCLILLRRGNLSDTKNTQKLCQLNGVSARDNTLGGRLRLFEGLLAASEPRSQSVE
jgi:hypothetical protein